ncbi:MAG TPA: hypothetical protein VH277_02665 [Gemmatimonadaceae bacterium]|nr:hypothetical protein [Gemmatimonadaceae bacterium]
MRNQSLARAAIIVTAVLATAAPRVHAQQRPDSASAKPAADQRYRFRLMGIYDEASGDPIEGVEVRDLFSGTSALTTKTGTVSLFFVPDGGSLVRIRKLGYEMQTFPVSISPVDTVPLTVVLRKAVQLPAVVVRDSATPNVSGPLRGALQRMKSGAGGHFIDEAEMRKWDESTMANALRSKMPGMVSTPGPRGETFFVSGRSPCRIALSGCKRPDCFVTVYIDGVRAALRPDFARLSPNDYAMAEFYAGGADQPPEYPGDCGSLLLWSRER